MSTQDLKNKEKLKRHRKQITLKVHNIFKTLPYQDKNKGYKL